jgi:DNA mismatch repair protein MutS
VVHEIDFRLEGENRARSLAGLPRSGKSDRLLAMAQGTPMMRQYRSIRGELPDDTILFFRLGDFYEMFFEDAARAAGILDIALTKRQNVPMCGIPYHAMDGYLAKLIKAGVKVAICDQVEDPGAAQGIVRREVTRVVTPGTVTSDHVLESNRNNYLAGLVHHDNVYGMALFDLSTGEFWVEECDSAAAARDNLARFSPTECVVPSEQLGNGILGEGFPEALGNRLTGGEDWTFDYENAHDILVRHFRTRSLEGFGCEGRNAVVGAAGGVLHYVRDELKHNIDHVRGLRMQNPKDYMMIDDATAANLDLIPVPGRDPGISLLHVLDTTRTAMGARMLRAWLVRPLADPDAIRARHEAVDAFVGNRAHLHELRETLAGVRDLERVMGRLAAGGGNARDLKALELSFHQLPVVRELLEGHECQALRDLGAAVEYFPELADLIGRAIDDEPGIGLKEGGIIKAGYHDALDELRTAASEGKQWLAEYQAAEQKRTGIKTIKVKYNKVFGYYIEVSRGQSDNVPDDYVRKQTLVNAERFITPELKEYENRILGAQDKSMALEYEIFVETRETAVRETARVQAVAEIIARLDVLSTFAERAMGKRYTRPEVSETDAMEMKNSRHPVVENIDAAERFVPNDVSLNTTDRQVVLITGPNMAGKSTYIRQVALVAIMAQAGSFVPADEATIGVVDRVFTRVGASDDLARGRSTFMVEMQETANILNNATSRSLIVLDEIGRGTSTFDGISIAWAVAEFLHNHERVKARTLFATHYHELTDLERTLPGVKNANVLVREQGDDIVFLRKIVPGAADQSYGIQVARLAGLPDAVIDRAREILANLEEGELSESGQPKIAKKRSRKSRDDTSQLNLFE